MCRRTLLGSHNLAAFPFGIFSQFTFYGCHKYVRASECHSVCHCVCLCVCVCVSVWLGIFYICLSSLLLLAQVMQSMRDTTQTDKGIRGILRSKPYIIAFTSCNYPAPPPTGQKAINYRAPEDTGNYHYLLPRGGGRAVRRIVFTQPLIKAHIKLGSVA